MASYRLFGVYYFYRDPKTIFSFRSVRPPNKSWKSISNLSGGEKTLSSLALVFALHYYRPTPLYVMDEIDAALDFKNVSIVANYIKVRSFVCPGRGDIMVQRYSGTTKCVIALVSSLQSSGTKNVGKLYHPVESRC